MLCRSDIEELKFDDPAPSRSAIKGMRIVDSGSRIDAETVRRLRRLAKKNGDQDDSHTMIDAAALEGEHVFTLIQCAPPVCTVS